MPGAVVHATDPNEDDLALIEIPDNPQLRFDSICAAPEGSNQDRMKVWYYGQNWSTGSAGAFVKVAQAALLLEANGLDGVSEGDSGGAVLGQLGLIGILSNYIPALDIAQKQQISFTSIDRVKAAVKNKFGEAAWQIPVCASRPIFRIKPSTCERPGASGCWVGAALDAFRSAPMDFGVRNQLARGIGQFLGEAELNELLATASPAQRLDILLNAALVSSSDSARRWLDSALNGIDQEHDRGSRLRHNAQAIGVLLRRGDRNRASSLARRMVDFSKDWPFEQRAGALVQLAYYSTDLQDPTLREELASKLGELVATVPPEKLFDTENRIAQWFKTTAAAEAAFTPSTLALRRLRVLGALPPLGAGGRSRKFYDLVRFALSDLVFVYSTLGDGGVAAHYMASEANWWEEGREYWQVAAHQYALKALTDAHRFDEARALLLTGLTYSEKPDFDRKDIRYAGQAIDSFYDLAKTAMNDSARRRRADEDFAFARQFAAKNVFPFSRDQLLEFATRGAEYLCAETRAAEATRWYVEAIKWIATTIAIQSAGFQLFTSRDNVFDLEAQMKGSQFALPASTAQKLGVDLPLCIAEAYDRTHNDSAARTMQRIAYNNLYAGRTMFDAADYNKRKTSFDTLPPELQAEFLVAHLLGLASNIFKAIDSEIGKATYGRTLVNLGGIETAKSALGDKEWGRLLNSEEGRHALFRAYLRTGRTLEAKALFDAQSGLRARYRGAYSDGSLFSIASAVEYVKLGNNAGAVAAVSQLSSSADRYNVQQMLVNELFNKSLTADDFERQISSFAALTWESAEYINRIIAWDYVKIGDPDRASWTIEKVFAKKSDLDAVDYLILPPIIELRRTKSAYKNASSLIEYAQSANMQATSFLQLAGVW
ncbi:hypothetical protein BJ6T_82410 [Bradyrhizobium japonicum USDA 6]|nr:hypothetical protein BJ6T_82410 [Bradyrhizobium japonicum USDA 6]